MKSIDSFSSTTETRGRLFGIGIVIVWLLVWEWSTQSGLLNRLLLVPPSMILSRLYRSLLITGELKTHVWATVTRLMGGLDRGCACAVARFQNGSK